MQHSRKFQAGKHRATTHRRAVVGTALGAAVGSALVLTGPMAVAAGGTTTATGVFNAADDTVKPVNDTNPRGSVTFSQPTGGGPITGVVRETGLGPNKPYIVVAYTDGACIPDPGGTAFPSSRFVTDGNGNATVNVTITPNSLNPVGQLDLRNVHSISTREVLVGSVQSGPITGPKRRILHRSARRAKRAPHIGEGCDVSASHRSG